MGQLNSNLGLKVIPFFWGFAEAVFFFIVPDVWLTWLAFTGFQKKELGLAVLWATMGAVLGGILAYSVGLIVPADVLSVWFDLVPGIGPSMVDSVIRMIQQSGIWGMFAGIFQGIPYKLFAAFWGTVDGSAGILVVTSILARSGRFVLTIALAKYVDFFGGKIFRRWDAGKPKVFLIFWITFYIFYFSYYSH